MKIDGYIRCKSKKAEDAQVITILYHTLKNTEVIGVKCMDKELLLQRAGERLEELRLEYTKEQVNDCFDELMKRHVIMENNEGKVELV